MVYSKEVNVAFAVDVTLCLVELIHSTENEVHDCVDAKSDN